MVITFLGEQTLGLAGEVIHLSHSLSNKRPSHLFTTIFGEEEFTTFHRRAFYFQSAIINTKSFPLLAKLFFSITSTVANLKFSKNFPFSLAYDSLYIFEDTFFSLDFL